MITDWIWSLQAGQCVGCGVCADICTSAAIVMDRSMPVPEPVANRCVGCMDCVQECPTEAITVSPRIPLANYGTGH